VQKSRQYTALKQQLMDTLLGQLKPELTYHGRHHVLDVLDVCEQYIKRLKLNERDAELLRTGALLHDIGFLYTYQDHEEKGVEVAREILPKYGYSPTEILIVTSLIRATKVPQDPFTDLEQIICDADLDYLGRADFEPISESLFQELRNVNLVHDRLTWDRIQIKFLESHTYHTDYARKHRQPHKAARLAEIRKRVEGRIGN
jgi:uncharacterized protein